MPILLYAWVNSHTPFHQQNEQNTKNLGICLIEMFASFRYPFTKCTKVKQILLTICHEIETWVVAAKKIGMICVGIVFSK